MTVRDHKKIPIVQRIVRNETTAKVRLLPFDLLLASAASAFVGRYLIEERPNMMMKCGAQALEEVNNINILYRRHIITTLRSSSQPLTYDDF